MSVDDVALPPAGNYVGTRRDPAVLTARISQMLRDRAAGMTYAQIAEQHGYSDRSTVRKVLIQYLREHASESAMAMRELENERLDVGVRVVMAIMLDTASRPEDRLRAVAELTRLSNRRSAMNGLDAPKQIEVTDGTAVELENAISTLRQVVTGEVLSSDDDEPVGRPADSGEEPDERD